jgi:hypothetical protein
MSKKELYLHIGTHKTGTTALQAFFAVNREKFRANGIVYPYDRIGGGEAGLYRLSWAVQSEAGIVDERFPADLQSSAKEWDFVLKQCDCPKALVSTEGFWDCLPEHVERIKELTSGFLVKIVVYLRRQDYFEDAWYNQLVKDLRCMKTHLGAGMFPVKKKFSQWTDIFGRGNMIVRPYEKQQFYGGTIFADFLHSVWGQELTDVFSLQAKNSNPRLHVALEYRRQVNLLPLSNQQKFMTLDPLLEISELLSEKKRISYPVLSPAERLELVRGYNHFYAEIAHNYLGREGCQLFYEPLPDPNEPWQKYDCLLAEDARFINNYLREHHPDVLEMISTGIDAAKKSDDLELQGAARRLAPGFVTKLMPRSFWGKSIFSKVRGHGTQKPREELFIHIGKGKTGTSALQTFFLQNRDSFNKYGIVYPLCREGKFNHHYLAWSLLKEEGVEKIYPKDTRTSVEEWNYVLSQLIGKQNLISSELLAGLSFDAVSKIKESVSDFDVKIIIYLRRYDNWLESVYNQKVKGKGISCLPKKLPEKNSAEIWAKVFSKENVIVRPYEKGQFYQGTIFADFLHYAFKMELTEDFLIPEKPINSRLQRMINCLSLSAAQKMSLIDPLHKISSRLYEEGRREWPVFSPRQRLEMIRNYEPMYAEIAKKYLGREDGRLFYEPLPDIDEQWQPYDRLLAEDARFINDHLSEHHPNAIKTILAGIDAARISEDPDVQEATRRLVPGLDEVPVPQTAPVEITSLQTESKLLKMPQKELYIHIGTHKTGTTALQQFFLQNREVLKQKGIEYPVDVGGDAGHHRLGWSFHKEGGRPSNKFPADLKSSEEEWSSLLRAGGNKILLSSETLYNCNAENMRHIKEYTVGFQVKFIVYLRRQDSMAASVSNQITKASERKWTDYEKLPYKMNYIDCLEILEKTFGKENVIVRPYEKQQFYAGTIFADFLHYVFGQELTEEFQIPEGDINSRLHPIILEYKRLLNHLPIPFDQLIGTLGPLLELSVKFFEENRPDPLLLSPEKRIEIIHEYDKMNQQIARDYLGRTDGRLFYDPLPDRNEIWDPYQTLKEEDAGSINQYLAKKHSDILAAIRQGILAAQSCEDESVQEAARLLSPGILLNDEFSGNYSKRITTLKIIYNRMPRRLKPLAKEAARKLNIIK